ncbi:nectin-4 [Haplochromis burtoni]|uniref:nectin-4 n=1 Tax=Haplochromis burtoni TaxID=8153 RepID=UPI001C2DD703|nr:nectin-4 [Haplochromis burtoni]XP_042079299.1 nectin-4 [Haplochromis burtoni]
MSIGTLKMTGNVLRMVLTLLLLAPISQGIQGVELFHYEKMEAVVGQNVSLLCTLKSATDNKIVSIEWSKETNKTTKLGLYSQFYGIHVFWQNITIQIEKNGTDVLGSHLILSDVKKSDEGIYVCDMATFPDGSKKVKTQLIIKGIQGVELFHYEKMEAVVGQNVSLPCTLKSATDNKIVSIEWSKETNKTTKLGLHSQFYGFHLFWQNITIQIEKNGRDVLGSHLILSDVKKSDEGIYVCDMATFPDGSKKVKTQLIIKDDIKITCDVNGTVEVQNGENVKIRCTSFPNAQYRWTKNDELLSETESLELWWVTDANAGIYTLTVNTGSKRVRKEFVVTVQPQV